MTLWMSQNTLRGFNMPLIRNKNLIKSLVYDKIQVVK